MSDERIDSIGKVSDSGDDLHRALFEIPLEQRSEAAL